MDSRAIWIDLDNSPHVPLFVPIIRHYRDQEVEVIVTARDHSQTLELLELHGLADTFTVVGSHYGKSKVNKVRGLLVRSKQLVSHINKHHHRISVAVSHGSRSMVLAARWLRIPVITMYDYEFTETGIFNRFSDKVLVPAGIPDETLDEIGLPTAKRVRYSGVKEELYLSEYVPASGVRQQIGVPDTAILAVVRPPATTANYHNDKSEALLDDILAYLTAGNDVSTVIVPRTAEQADDIRQSIAAVERKGSVTILDSAIDGLDLIAAADLVVSGGGTMNREAALLGVPVYSIFAGRQGALDRQMERDGVITFIRDARDLSKVRLERRSHSTPTQLTNRVKNSVVAAIDEFL